MENNLIYCVNKRKRNRNWSKLCYYTILYWTNEWQRDMMVGTTRSMDNYSAVHRQPTTDRVLSEISKMWIKILFITLIFALVQTSTPPSSIQIQKRGISVLSQRVARESHKIFRSHLSLIVSSNAIHDSCVPVFNITLRWMEQGNDESDERFSH